MMAAVIFEHHEGWVVMAQFGRGQKSLYIPCVDLETEIRYLAFSGCDTFVIQFLNGTSLDVDHNTWEVR